MILKQDFLCQSFSQDIQIAFYLFFQHNNCMLFAAYICYGQAQQYTHLSYPSFLLLSWPIKLVFRMVKNSISGSLSIIGFQKFCILEFFSNKFYKFIIRKLSRVPIRLILMSLKTNLIALTWKVFYIDWFSVLFMSNILDNISYLKYQLCMGHILVLHRILHFATVSLE